MPQAHDTAQEIVDACGRALAVHADVSQENDIRATVAQVAAHYGRVDLLVNNAGVTEYIPLQDLDAVTDATWDRIFAVNVKGIFYCARAVATSMRAQGHGATVNNT